MGRAAHPAEVESLWIAFACEMDSTIGSVVSGWAAEIPSRLLEEMCRIGATGRRRIQRAPGRYTGTAVWGSLMSSLKLGTSCQAPGGNFPVSLIKFGKLYLPPSWAAVVVYLIS